MLRTKQFVWLWAGFLSFFPFQPLNIWKIRMPNHTQKEIWKAWLTARGEKFSNWKQSPRPPPLNHGSLSSKNIIALNFKQAFIFQWIKEKAKTFFSSWIIYYLNCSRVSIHMSSICHKEQTWHCFHSHSLFPSISHIMRLCRPTVYTCTIWINSQSISTDALKLLFETLLCMPHWFFELLGESWDENSSIEMFTLNSRQN